MTVDNSIVKFYYFIKCELQIPRVNSQTIIDNRYILMKSLK